MRGQLRQYPHPLARNVSLPGKHPVTAANEPGLQKTRCCDCLLTRYCPVLQPRAIRFGALTRNQSKLFDGHRRRAFLSDGRLANGRHHGLWFSPATAPASTRARPYRPCRQITTGVAIGKGRPRTCLVTSPAELSKRFSADQLAELLAEIASQATAQLLAVIENDGKK